MMKIKLPIIYAELYKKQTKLLLQSLTKDCPECKGEGYILLEDNMYKDCSCVQRFFSFRKYTQAGINVKHVNRDDSWFEKEFTKETFKKLQEIKSGLDEALRINFIISPATISHWGASQIGNQIIKYCIDSDKYCAVASSKHVMDLFFAFNDDDLLACKEYLEAVDVLLIDEFGAEYNAKMKDSRSFIACSFNSFFMERKRLNKTTIIASNLPANKLKESYAEDIMKVIVDNFVGLKVTSSSKRKSEFDGLEVKLSPNLRSCFEEISTDDHVKMLAGNKKKFQRTHGIF